MTLGIYNEGFINAEEIEVELFTTPENKIIFKKSDDTLVTTPEGPVYVYLFTTLLNAGIIYCQFRTTIDGVTSQWTKRHLAYRQ